MEAVQIKKYVSRSKPYPGQGGIFQYHDEFVEVVLKFSAR